MAERPDLAEVESFNKSGLKHTDTTEKSGALEGYAQEKTLEQVASFSKEQLKHVETEEKNSLPTQSEIEQEKKSDF